MTGARVSRETAPTMVSLALLGLLGAGLFHMLSQGWPLLNLDSVLYFQVASNIAEGKGYIFENYARLYYARGVDDWQFDLHGQLFAPTLAAFASSGSYVDLIKAAALLNVLALAAAWAAAWMTLTRFGKLGWTRATLSLALGLGAMWVGTALTGRPEQLIPLVLCIGWILREAFPKLDPTVLAGLEIALIAAISPLPGSLAGLIYAYFALRNPNTKAALTAIATLALVAGIGWFVVTWMVSPYSPLEVLKNTVLQAFSAIGSGWVSRKFVLWEMTLDPRKPGLILVWMLGAAAVIAWTFNQSTSRLKRVIVVLLGLLLLGVIYKACAEQTLTYNLIGLALIPARHALEVWATGEVPAKFARWFPHALIVAVVFPGFGALEALRHYPDYRRGADLAAAQAALRPYLDSLSGTQRIVVSEVAYPPTFLLEALPGKILTVGDLTPAQIGQLSSSFGITVRYVLVSGTPVARDFEILVNYQVRRRFPICEAAVECAATGYPFTLFELR